MIDKIFEKKQEFEMALQIVENIIEGEKIDRFKFTNKEKQTLIFINDLLSTHIKEFENYK